MAAALAAGALGLAVAVASHAAGALGGLLKVRLGGDAQQTRLVLDLDQAASGKLVSDGASDGHAILLLPSVSATGGLQGAGQGLVKAWAIEQTSGGARLQLDLAPDARIKGRFLLPPADGIDHYRYVVDVTSQPGAVRLTSAKASTVTPVALRLRPQIAPVQTLPVSLKKVIVIDPGHGGHDPGALGAQGFEKDVNLAAALALKERLERSPRYRVVMTRDDDTYVPLDERVRIAQRAGADLFISLHSDSGGDPSVRGASVYTLSDKASNRATRFVKRDDWFMKASLTGDRGVSDILFDLTQRATKNRSAAFANTLVSHIDGKAPLLRRSQRDAGFMVLLAPDVPAVLLEMGFVTNPEDEQFLRDPGQRKRLMNAVGDSIDDYFAEATRLASR
ncbi:MAG TPA: N-acetylmuramoyl-L-alanine amidase [Phenylobacterium sp.]|uniref:N-acetylmuramoyl-L-alanine amidase family protein n=1 Tax=Phenylobacterium sp. TaxID=1871053 RepID=UPI002D4966CB|nr:N-acetylmuramoyl-L-alanine amidase [Phenylobacterium sp.]HZZ68439.1 N-acetylmuramoyl-L-alanine amidase [Phenylobacterium sp.]